MCWPTVIDQATADLIAARSAVHQQVSTSPFGADDEIGMLNLISAESVRTVLANVDPWKVYDMGTDLFVGMPCWTGEGDLAFQIWQSHSPLAYRNDNPDKHFDTVSYTGDSVAFYTHTGTHVDTFNHYGYHMRIWNNFSAEEDLGRVWKVCGPDKHPPMISRGIMLDIPALAGVDVLPDSYGIGAADLKDALKHQGTELRTGDVVMVRTGRMSRWPDMEGYILDSPGLTMDGAKFLAEAGAITIGSDNVGIEQIPAPEDLLWPPVHTYLLAEAGVPMIEVVNLEELSRDRTYEFAFIGAALKLRGASGAPIRPMAIPLAN
jgi:kynurenine formamidase